MADTPPANFFGNMEPSSHPTAGKGPVVEAPVAADPRVSAQFVGTSTPTVTPSPAPTGVAAPVGATIAPVAAAAAPAVDANAPPSDMFTMANPYGQSVDGPTVPIGNDPAGTIYPPPAPPDGDRVAHYPMLQAGLIATGTIGGGLAGVPAGGIVADAVTVPAGGILGGMAGSMAYDVTENIIDSIRGLVTPDGKVTLTQQTINALKNGAMSLGGIEGQAGGTLIAQGAAKFLNVEKGYAGTALRSAGSILGGGTGTALANLGADQAIAVTKIWGLIPPEQRTPELLESIKEAAMNGGLDMVVNTALHVPLVGKAAARYAMFKINGITAEMVADAEVASRFGINLSPAIVSKSGISKLYRTVMSVIPIVGHPYTDLYNKNVEAIDAYAKGLREKAAPTGTRLPTQSSAATDAVSAANDAFKPVVDAYNDRRNILLGRARAEGIQFNLKSRLGVDDNGNPVGSLKDWAGVILKRAERRVTRQYDMTPGAKPDTLEPLEWGKTNVKTENKELLDLANKIALSPDKMTADQLEAIGEEADAIYKKYADMSSTTDEIRARLAADIKAFKDSFHGAFADSASTDPARRSWTAVGESLRENRAQYVEARKIFETPVGVKLTTRKNGLDPAIIGDAIYKMETPAQVDQLIKIVGRDKVAAGASVFLQNAYSDAAAGIGSKKVFDVETFANRLGIDDRSSDKYQAVKMALDVSGIRMSDMENFVKYARQIQENMPPAWATMLTRKMTFGGLNSVLSAVFPLMGAAAGHSILGPGVGEIGTAGFVLLGWKGAEIMSNPKYLRDANIFLNPAETEAARRMAFFRVAQAVLPNDLPRYGDRTPVKQGLLAKTGQAAYEKSSGFLESIMPQPQLLQ